MFISCHLEVLNMKLINEQINKHPMTLVNWYFYCSDLDECGGEGALSGNDSSSSEESSSDSSSDSSLCSDSESQTEQKKKNKPTQLKKVRDRIVLACVNVCMFVTCKYSGWGLLFWVQQSDMVTG